MRHEDRSGPGTVLGLPAAVALSWLGLFAIYRLFADALAWALT